MGLCAWTPRLHCRGDIDELKGEFTGGRNLLRLVPSPVPARAAGRGPGRRGTRTATLGTRSIKTSAKDYAIDLAIRMVDLTTLEGATPPARCGPWPTRRCGRTPPTRPARRWPPSVSTPTWSPGQGDAGSTGVKIASVATAFPSGRAARTSSSPTSGRGRCGCRRDRHGDRPGAFLSGHYIAVFEEIAQNAKHAPADGSAHLKVIFETGELQTYDNVRRASWLAMMAGAHFIKTSTGKSSRPRPLR